MAGNKTDSVRVNTYMPCKLLAVAKRFAARRGVSYSEVMRNALTEYMQREIKREKEA